MGEVIQQMAKEAGFNISHPADGVRRRAGRRTTPASSRRSWSAGAGASIRTPTSTSSTRARAASTRRSRATRPWTALLNKAREVSDQKERADALPAGDRPDRRAPQHRLPLPPELHRGLPEEPEGLQGGARRTDPHQGRELELGPIRPWGLSRAPAANLIGGCRGRLPDPAKLHLAGDPVPDQRHRVRRRPHDPRRSRPRDGGDRRRRRRPRGDPRRSTGSRTRCPCSTCAGSGCALRGDLGESIRTRESVLRTVGQKLPITLELACLLARWSRSPSPSRPGCSRPCAATRPGTTSPAACPSAACRSRTSGWGSC